MEIKQKIMTPRIPPFKVTATEIDRLAAFVTSC